MRRSTIASMAASRSWSERSGIIVALEPGPLPYALRPRVAPLELAHQVLHHPLDLRVLLLAFFLGIPRLGRMPALEQLGQFLGRQGFALLAGVGSRLAQKLRQLRLEFTAIVYALRRHIGLFPRRGRRPLDSAPGHRRGPL